MRATTLRHLQQHLKADIVLARVSFGTASPSSNQAVTPSAFRTKRCTPC